MTQNRAFKNCLWYHTCICVHMCIKIRVEARQRSKPNISLYFSSLSFLETKFLTEPGAHWLGKSIWSESPRNASSYTPMLELQAHTTTSGFGEGHELRSSCLQGRHIPSQTISLMPKDCFTLLETRSDSLHIPGWPTPLSVDQANLKLTEIHLPLLLEYWE